LRACFGSLVLSILSRWLIQFCLYLSLTSCIPEISISFLMTSLLILSSLVYHVILLRKCSSAASRPVISLFVVPHVSLPFSSDGLATTLKNFVWVSARVFFKFFPNSAAYSLESLFFCQNLVHRLNSVRIPNK